MKKKGILKHLFVITFALFPLLLVSQPRLGIGTATPNSSAVLDVASSSKGFLVPRMSQTARLAINSPANGLLVYDSTLHRLYQYQEGTWRYMLTNAQWTQSPAHNWTYNIVDSVGLGTSVPTERLDVAGDIKTTHDLLTDNNVVSDGSITASTISSPGSMVANGNVLTNGNATSYNNLNIDDGTIQLQDNGIKKAFLQVSGNDLRLGTNSGNTIGKLILRMNAVDVMSIDRHANIEMLQDGITEGNVVIGWKLTRVAAPEVNMLPVIFGYVPADGSGAGWISPFGLGSWNKTGTGRYEITCLFGITPYSAIIVTPSQAGRLCMATYISSGKFRIETFDRFGTPVDCAFTYVVNDPLN